MKIVEPSPGHILGPGSILPAPKHLKIPREWTFKSNNVAENFDAHVREQLPWYDQATKAVAHIARHYIPECGRVYDIGASTGNIGRALAETIKSRRAEFIAVEESLEMCKLYIGPIGSHAGPVPGVAQDFIPKMSIDRGCSCTLLNQNAILVDFLPFDFAVCFLSIMFLPITHRKLFISRLISSIVPGGALVVVDKCVTPPGYIGSVLRRMTMAHKLEAGASAEDILKKELSLAGYQRPMTPDMFDCDYQEFFRFGEFAGWVIERGES